MNASEHSALAVVALAGAILLSAVGQLLMKAGMLDLRVLLDAQPQGWTPTALWEPALWAASGLLAYACSLVCWLLVLVRYPLNFAYPLLGLSYVLVYVGAVFWPHLAEPATLTRTLGTLLILLGVALASGSAPLTDSGRD